MPPAASRASRRPQRSRPARLEVPEGAAPGREDRLRRARQVLKVGSRDQIDALFWDYHLCRADGRWGLENPYQEILGALRIAAIKSLRGHPGRGGKHHEMALIILGDAGKPRDLPLLTGLLADAEPGRCHELCGAIDRALEGCTEPHPALIAALEDLIARSTTAREAEYPARTLGACAIPEAEEALDRLRQRVAPWPRVQVLTVMLRRDPRRHRDEAAALLAALSAAVAAAPDDHEPSARYTLDLLGEALEAPGEPGAPLPSIDLTCWPADDAAWTTRLAALDERTPSGPLLAALPGASPARQVLLLRAFDRLVARRDHAFFHVVWPLTQSMDDAVALAAIHACVSAGSQQARLRLQTRQRKATAAGDARTARLIEEGLVTGHQAYLDR